MIHQLPDVMTSAASARELGPLHATARDGNRKVFKAAVSAAVPAALAWYLALKDGASIGWLVVAIVFSLVAVAFALVPVLLRGSLLAVHAGGLVRRVDGAAVEAWRWDELRGVTGLGGRRRGDLSQVPPKVVAVLGNGRRITVLNTCEGYVEFVDALQGCLEASVEADALRRLDGGEVLTFGAVRMDWQGLTVQLRQVPWSSIARVDVQDGYLVVMGPVPAQPVLTVPLEEVTDVEGALLVAGLRLRVEGRFS